MICSSCKLAADIPEFEGGRHADCYNVAIKRDGLLEARDFPIKGCDCQHHPVGTGQIKKTEENA